MAYATAITFGSLTIAGGNNTVQGITKRKVPGTLKQVVGQKVLETPIPGRNKEWSITIRGRLTGTNKDTDRTTLEGYDVGTVRKYIDGMIDADFVVIDLNWDDSATTKTTYNYTLRIKEYTQT